jgi:hypothetical protein
MGILLEDLPLSLIRSQRERERGPFWGAGEFVCVGVGGADEGELEFWIAGTIRVSRDCRKVHHTQYAISSSLNAVSTAFKPVNTVDPLGL